MPYEIIAGFPGNRKCIWRAAKRDGLLEKLCSAGIGHDAAGYVASQGLRNVLLISATPYQLETHDRAAGYADAIRMKQGS